MALSTATITANLSDMLGTDFDTRRTKVWVSTNVPGDTVVDTVGNAIRIGSGTTNVNSDGTLSLAVWTPGTGSNPASWQTTINVDYPDPGTRSRKTRAFGPFTITTSADLADLIAEQEIPPEYADSIIAEMAELRDEAQAAAADARDVSGISTPEGVIAASVSVNARTMLATPGASAGANRTILLNALNAATVAGAPLDLRGDFPVTGGTIAPTGAVTVNADEATFTQTDNLTTTLTLKSGSVWQGGTFIGKGTDFVDTTANLPAAAIRIADSASDVTLINVRGNNLAGCGVRAVGTISGLKLLFCEFDGVGTAGGIVAGTSKDGGGLSLQGIGNSDIYVIGGHYKGFPQGMTAGDIDGVFIGGGVEVEGIGQHGIYFESVKNGVVSGVHAKAALEGIKFQLGDGSADSLAFSISDVVMELVGSHGLHLVNAQTTPTNQHKQGVISNVSVIGTVGSGGDGVLLEYCNGVSVNNVRTTNGRRGIRVLNSQDVTVDGFRSSGYTQVGIYLAGVQGSSFNRFKLKDGSTGGPGGTDPHSVLINDPAGAGSTTSDITFSNGELRAGSGAPVNHLYLASGDVTTMNFINLFGEGASSYGARFASAGLKVRQWTNVDVNGTTARFNNPPIQSRTTDANGLLGKNYDPVLAGIAQAAMTAGVLYVQRVPMPEGGIVTNVLYHVSTAGATLTSGQCLIGVYDEAGTLIGQSADQSGVWNSTGVKTTALVTPTASQPVRGFVDIAFLWNGTTSPQLRGFNGSTQGNIGISANALNRFATAGTSQTTLPSTLPTKAAGSTQPWVGVN